MSPTTQFNRIISADSHVVEPFDLWNALGHKFGDRTPRRIDNFLGRGKSAFYHGRKGAEVSEIRGEAAQVQAEEHGLGACGSDPAVRLDFQKEAGVEAEVLNTTHMLYIMGNPDVWCKPAPQYSTTGWPSSYPWPMTGCRGLGDSSRGGPGPCSQAEEHGLGCGRT